MKSFYSFFLLLLPALSVAQTQPVLEGYIKLGISENQALKQSQFAFEKSLVVLREANGLLMPSATFDFQYTAAKGGRTIDLPLGDLFNPVYGALNQLTGSNAFPVLENQSIQFLPNDFHTTRLVATQPLLNAEILYNRKIKQELITYQQAEVNVYKRELVKQIKLAYYKYLQAGKALDIYRSAMGLVKENLRMNEKLVKNQVALQSNVYRSKAEMSKLEVQLVEAENNQKLAAAYFNFLLNQPFETPIATDSILLLAPLDAYLTVASEASAAKREELLKLTSALRVNDNQVKLSKSYLIPTIGHSLEAGYQGFGFKYDNTQDYFLYGLSLRWNLFKGFGNQLKVQQSQLDRKVLESQLDNAEKQIGLQVQTAQYNLRTAQQSLLSAKDALANSREFFRIIDKRYLEGQALLLEYLDARNQLTSAEISESIARFGLLIRMAELEQATASYPL